MENSEYYIMIMTTSIAQTMYKQSINSITNKIKNKGLISSLQILRAELG